MGKTMEQVNNTTIKVVTYQRLKSLACLYAKSREACGRVTLLPD